MNEYQTYASWLSENVEDSFKKITESSTFVVVVTEKFLNSPKCALEVGMALLMDKPIIIICSKTMKIPKNLLSVAKAVERVDFNDDKDQKRVAETINNIARTYGG